MNDNRSKQLLAIKQLVLAFNSGDGLPGAVFDSTCVLIETIMGTDAVRTFALYIRFDPENDSCRFEGIHAASPCWSTMIHAAELDGHKYYYLHDLVT